jgi:hypothetical protein
MGILVSSMNHPEDALVITFDPSGQVESLHIDQFDLGFLGKKSIQRATDIVYDEAKETWGIYLLDDEGHRKPPVHGSSGFATYETARKVEVGWLNLCRLNDIDPVSDYGHVLLNQARKYVGLPI